jgi:hypothetical protein
MVPKDSIARMANINMLFCKILFSVYERLGRAEGSFGGRLDRQRRENHVGG